MRSWLKLVLQPSVVRRAVGYAIVIDGAEGGAGAAPLELSNRVGMPLRDGLALARNLLVGANLRDRIRLGTSGAERSPPDTIMRQTWHWEPTGAMRGAPSCSRSDACNIRTTHGHPGVASYYRSIAYWPDFLAAVWGGIRPRINSEAYRRRKQELLHLARALVEERLNPHPFRAMGDSVPPDGAAEDSFQGNHASGRPEAVIDAIRIGFRGIYIGNGGYTAREARERIQAGR